MICTTLRSTPYKSPAKFIYYRSYNNYNKGQFENTLKQRLVSSSNFGEFFDIILATLNEQAPLKKKKMRDNHQVFLSKTLRKAIIKRSKLRNTFSKKRSSENWQNYKWQRNICSNILKSTKKTFKNSGKQLSLFSLTRPDKTSKTSNNIILTFKHQSHKMIKHTQTIRQQIANKLFECVWPSCEIDAKRVNRKKWNS